MSINHLLRGPCWRHSGSLVSNEIPHALTLLSGYLSIYIWLLVILTWYVIVVALTRKRHHYFLKAMGPPGRCNIIVVLIIESAAHCPVPRQSSAFASWLSADWTWKQWICGRVSGRWRAQHVNRDDSRRPRVINSRPESAERPIRILFLAYIRVSLV